MRPGSAGWIALSHILHGDDRRPKGFATDLWTVISGIEGIGEDAYEKVAYGSIPIRMFNIQSLGQQAPNPESPIVLGEKRDALGLPEPKLDLRLSDIDRRSITRTVEIFAQELGKAGLGRAQVTFQDWPEQPSHGDDAHGQQRQARRSRFEQPRPRGWKSLRGRQFRISDFRLRQPNPNDRRLSIAARRSY